MKLTLNIVQLNRVVTNVIGDIARKISRYVPDDEVPDSHTPFYGADGQWLEGTDDEFYGKL